jgi:hypothetical protein
MPSNTFKVGEMLNKRTRNSKTWINFDGSYTTEIYQGPVHFTDENGNYQNINTDLFDEADFDIIDVPVSAEVKERFHQARIEAKAAKAKGVLNRELFNYQAIKLPFDAHIPRNFKRGYTVGKGVDKLTFVPVNASPSMGVLSSTDRSVITYQDVWNDTDVELKVLTNGIKETIWLKTDRAPSTFTFEVKGALADDFTAGQLKLAPAWLIDANSEKRDVPQTIRRVDGLTYIDVVADVTGLTYPIEIDPTVTIQPDATAGKDAYVMNASASSNYNDSLLKAGEDGNSWVFRSFLQFDLSAIPSNSKVTDSVVSLIMSNYYGAGSPEFQMFAVTSEWGETTVTWNTQPTVGTVIEAKTAVGTTTGPHVFNITALTDKWVNAQLVNHGIMLRIYDETINIYRGFTSSDSTSTADRPKLSVTYNQPPTAPTVTAPNGGETWNSLHTVAWNVARDIETEIISDIRKYDYLLTGTEKLGQTFTITDSPNTTYEIRDVEFYTTASVTLDAHLYETDGNYPTNIIKTVSVTTVANGWGKVSFNVAGLSKDVKYAIVFSNQSADVYFATDDNSGNFNHPGGNFVRFTTSWGANSYDFLMKIKYDTGISLQYNIQLSTDDGVNWKDIVGLTTAGVTSYDYDFINEAESSTSLIRIRAYDGASYGPWDQSDGVFTIKHNTAPTAPTNLSPSGGVSKDRALVQRLSWQHNDSDGDPQAQFDLQWRLQGATTWNTVSQVTTNQYWDAPGGTFPRGTIEWQVRTYDQAGLSSPYSALATFYAGDKPANPTITSPTDGSTVSVANPTVQWSSVGQTDFHLKVKDTANVLLWESIRISTNKAETVQYDLQNGTSYKIELAIKNADGLWSDFVAVNISVSFTPPAKAIVTTSKDDSRGSITIAIDNPTPSGTEPTVSYNSVFRRKQGESTFIRIATNIAVDSTFTDYTPQSATNYEYKVRTWGDNGTYSDSDVVSNSVTVSDAQLALVSDFGQWVELVFGSDRTEGRQRNRTMMKFAGRESPVSEFGEHFDLGLNLSYQIWDVGELQKLIDLCDSKQTLLYRDNRGRREFVTVDGVSIKDELPNYYGVSLSPTRVSFEEEV